MLTSLLHDNITAGATLLVLLEMAQKHHFELDFPLPASWLAVGKNLPKQRIVHHPLRGLETLPHRTLNFCWLVKNFFFAGRIAYLSLLGTFFKKDD